MKRAKALLNTITSNYSAMIEDTSVFNQYDVIQCDTEQWLDALKLQPALAIIDANQFDQQSYELLASYNFFPETDFIFLSEGHPNELLDQAVLKCAAYHYRTPIDQTQLRELVDELSQEQQQSVTPQNIIKTSELDQFGLLFGSSRVMKKLYRNLRKVAGFDTSVLIVGESGVGKELVAHTIHNASQRADQPFIAVNCGALSKELATSDLFGHVKGAFTGAHSSRDGFFTQARGGTLFLDEVTEMPEELQVHLLRVLETGDYAPVGSNKTLKSNVRIIAATNRELAEAIADGTFREDLYFRLAQFLLHIPPLRSRGDDIQGLAKHFLAYKNSEESLGKKITDAALTKIQAHTWPGNVRELKYTIERAYILASDIIDEHHILIEAPSIDETNAVPSGMPLAEIEKQAILNTLEEQQGNKSNTARVLDISVKTLYNKLEKYDDNEP